MTFGYFLKHWILNMVNIIAAKHQHVSLRRHRGSCCLSCVGSVGWVHAATPFCCEAPEIEKSILLNFPFKKWQHKKLYERKTENLKACMWHTFKRLWIHVYEWKECYCETTTVTWLWNNHILNNADPHTHSHYTLQPPQLLKTILIMAIVIQTNRPLVSAGLFFS